MKYKNFTGFPLLLIVLLVFGACSVGAFFTGEEEKKLTPMDGKIIVEPAFVDYSVFRAHYEDLSVSQQQAYRLIYNSVFDHPERIKIPPVSLEELKEVVQALKNDNPHLLCLQNHFSYQNGENVSYLIPDYTAAHEECVKRTEALLGSAKTVAAAASYLPQGYDRELYIHDTLCTGTQYADGADAFNAYGALVEKTAVCEGYSYASKLIFDMVGIPACVVTGRVPSAGGGTESHMWNAVKIAGSWYHTDLTWDDPITGTENNLRHTYFNLSTGSISATHFNITVPSGIKISEKENESYFRKNGLECSAETWRAVISSHLDRAFKEDIHSLEFRFSDLSLLKAAAEDLFNNGGIYELPGSGRSAFEKVVSFWLDEDMLVLHLLW